MVRASANHLLSLINDVLDISKIEAGKIELFRETFQVREMVDAVMEGTLFRAGDVMLFDMFTLHGSCDNRMGGGRVRLSFDVRWQLAGEAEDDRWFGAPPKGHGDLSYGGLNGARPLGQAYIAR